MPITMTICARCACVVTPSNPHTECERGARAPLTERIADVKIGGHQGEYLDVTRQPNGLLTIRHFIPGTRPADTVVLEPDEAAQLATFIIRTLTRGVRYGITEAGRALLAGSGT